MIALSIICKGTESVAQTTRLLNSVAPYVDAIYVTYTWQKASAVEVFEKFGANISYFKWVKDFSQARNFAMKQIPKEYTHMLWLDMDDVLVGGENLKELALKEVDAIYATYNYQIDETTNEILVSHPRERLIKLGKFKWVAPLHETLIPQGKVSTMFTDKFVVNHYPDEEEHALGLPRNIEILETMYAQEKVKDPRTEYYLARCYYDAGAWDKAYPLLVAYLKHSGWDEERAMAHNYLSEILQKEERWDEALSHVMEAIKERPEYPSWYVSLGVIYAKTQDWDKALFHVKKALVMKQPKTSMVLTPRDDKLRALEVIFVCSMNKSMLKEALEAVNELALMFPDSEEYVEKAEYITHMIENVELGKGILALVKRLDKENPDKIEGLLNMLPEEMQDTALVEKLRQQYAVLKDLSDTIVYYCGKGFSEWQPTSLKDGIGGSETAVIFLTKMWAKNGRKVIVYGDPKEEGDYDGVTYLKYWRFNIRNTFGTFISWRNETLFDFPIKAEKKLLDYHDVINPLELNEERLKNIDTIMVKSEFHKAMLSDEAKKKAQIVTNGLNVF